MARRIEVPPVATLSDYEEVAILAPAVHQLREEARRTAPLLRDRTVWMVNSTEQGGGVAEMLPAIVTLLRELGVNTEWAVLETEEVPFFALTKHLHNLIHAEGDPALPADAREVFEAVNRENADQMSPWLRPGDILMIHDPQPMPLAAQLAGRTELLCIWRCHIGVDQSNEQTRTAWEFLRPYAEPYAMAVFSAPEYVPDFFAERASIITPALDPLTHKNRELSVHELAGVLANSGLTSHPAPVVDPAFEHPAERLFPDGFFRSAGDGEDIGLLFRPVVTQISRWDRLKGFGPLMEAFALLKQSAATAPSTDAARRRRLELARLLLVGPDPASVADDPEGQEVLAELIRSFQALAPAVQKDVVLLALPMASGWENALMVNAIQRASSVVVQNSIREGFGLTVTEAMWKGVPVLSNRKAVGPRQQIRDGVDGVLVDDPEDVRALADAMAFMLASPERRAAWGRSAQARAHRKFLIFSQLRELLRLMAAVAGGQARG